MTCVILPFLVWKLYLILDEDRVAVQHAVGVGHAAGVELAVLEVDLDVVGAELHVLVLHHGAAEEVGVTSLQVVDHGVLCAVLHRRGDGVGGDDLPAWGECVGPSRGIGLGEHLRGGVRQDPGGPSRSGGLGRRLKTQHTEYERYKQRP